MQLSTLLTLLAIGTTSVSAGRQDRVARQASKINNDLIANMVKRNMVEPDPSKFPADFGLTPGITPCTGDRAGANPAVRIPCDCPPAPNNATFRAAVKVALNLGFFPDQKGVIPDAELARTSMTVQQWNELGVNDPAAKKLRNQAMIVGFQSLTGVRGVGCPGVSAPVLGGSG